MVDAGIKNAVIKKSELPWVKFTTTYTAAKISNAVANGTTVTFTTSEAHNIQIGTRVSIFEVSPVVFNLSGALVTATPTATTFTVAETITGTYASGGTVRSYSVYDTVNQIYTFRDYLDVLYYDFRYRVVSEDKNRYSHWSPIIRYDMPDLVSPFPYTAATRFTISKAGNPEVVSAVWSYPSDAENPTNFEKFFRDINVYDVWIRWNNNNVTDLNDSGWTQWEFRNTVSSNNFSILKSNASAKRIEIAIQVPTLEKVRDYHNNKLTMFRGLSDTI